MSIIKEFKDFAIKGNVIDLAVGVIIGAAFGKIVSSLVSDIIMPPLGKVLNNVNFTELFISLDNKTYKTLADAKTDGAPIIAYGNFIQNLLDFFIVAFVIFLMVKGINSMKKKEVTVPAAAPEPTTSEKLLVEIRDLLKNKTN